MSSKRIEQAIDDIYEYIETCKPKGFSNSLIIVSKDELLDKLDELKLRIPDEVSRCSKILERREDILREAEIKAQKYVDDSAVKADAMIHDSEIMRQAYLQANEFMVRANQQAEETVAAANYEAEQLRNGAYEYTKDMLMQIENVLSASVQDVKAKSEAYIEALTRNLKIVTDNRRELCEEVAPEIGSDDEIEKDDGDNEDYNVNPEGFMRNND